MRSQTGIAFTGSAATLMRLCTVCLGVGLVLILPSYFGSVMFPANFFASNAMPAAMGIGLLGFLFGFAAIILRLRAK